MQTLLKIRLAQFGLSVADKKTHHTDMGARKDGGTHDRRRMAFLGFTIYRSKNRNQTAAKTVFQTDGKRFSRAKASMREKIRRIKHWPVVEQVKAINAILRGHFNYYGLAGNARRLQRFSDFTCEEWRHSLSKRSQKGRLNWERFAALLEQHPLVTPKLKINYSQMAAYARL